MKQLFQSLADGTTAVEDVPAPQVRDGYVLIRTQASIVSAGTERMLVDFGRANLIDKARQQPERVKEVMDKVRTDGLATTVDAVRSKLSRPITLGYANAGIVLAVGRGVTDLAPGDHVASNGPHAEVVSVPRNLVVKAPERDGAPLPAEEAAFAPIGAIALQGVRLAAPTIGERVVVTGLGLIGLLTVQLLRAQGCKVLGIDLDPARLELARELGASTVDVAGGTDPVAAAASFTGGAGVDAVILTASTSSSEPIRQAAQMCRKRGRIVLVGMTGLELQRADFYEKELSFQVSCSYGPGRYDPAYEEQGHDYPPGFVRWTAGRNFESFLDLVADGKVQLAPLVTHRYPLPDAATAYDTLSEDAATLGIALQYPAPEHLPDDRLTRRQITRVKARERTGQPRVAVIGAGNYTQQVLLPALAETAAVLDTVVSQGGATAAQAAKRFGFARASTDLDAVFEDEGIDALFITTRHDTHADLTLRALAAGKHVYVEKPLALTQEQVGHIADLLDDVAARGEGPLLMVGFNRRFSPLTVRLQRALRPMRAPRAVVITVNAGQLPAEHWTQDSEVGGGRIIGEACHFVDLARHLVGHPITDVHAATLDSPTGDSTSLQFAFADGSIATVHYLANGDRSYPKERVEVFCAGTVVRVDNFRSLTGFGHPSLKRVRLRSQDKGHRAAVAAFVDTVRSGGPAPIPVAELLEVSDAVIDAAGRTRRAT